MSVVRGSGIDRALAVVAVFFSTGAVLGLRGPTDSTSGDTFSQAVWLLLYGAAAFLLIRQRVVQSALADVPRVVWALLLLAACSVLWSAAPDVTARRAIALLGSTIIGMHLGRSFTRIGLLQVVAAALAIAATASLGLVLVAPGVGIAADVRGTDWRGVYAHKNTLGLTMALGSIMTWLASRGSARRHRGIWRLASLLCLFMLVMSGSRTGIVMLVVSVSVSWLIVSLVRAPSLVRSGATLILIPVAALGVCGVVSYLDQLTGLVGRDATLTGRSDIWAAVVPSIRERPLLGYGYEAFWGGSSSPARFVWARQGVGFGITEFRPLSAHNGWLNTWLNLGIGAVVLMAVLLLGMVRSAARKLRVSTGPELAAPLCFVVLYLLISMLEGAMMSSNNIFWVVLVACAMQLRTTEQAP